MYASHHTPQVSARAVAEKQISILERALVHHPGSESLLLALLHAVRASFLFVCVCDSLSLSLVVFVSVCVCVKCVWYSWCVDKTLCASPPTCTYTSTPPYTLTPPVAHTPPHLKPHHPLPTHTTTNPLTLQVALIEDPQEVATRWQRVLTRHPGSGTLWAHHIRAAQGSYATFAAGALRKGYGDALAALRGEVHTRRDQGAPREVVWGVEASWLKLFLQVW